MSNAKARTGAAISLLYGSELEVSSSTFSSLNALSNGGISLLDAKAIIRDSDFLNCTAISSGSGIYADDSELFMNNTVF